MKALYILLLLSPGVMAGPVYKCVDTKGVSSFQQTPCPKVTKEAWHGQVAKAPDDTGQSWTSQKARQPQYVETTSEEDVSYTSSAPHMSQFEQNERQRRAEHIAGDRSLSTSERRTLMAAELGQPAPAPYVAPSVPYTPPTPVPAPQQIRDYDGNTYTQPPGSAFARDNKTDQNCFVYGNFIKCK